MDVQGTLPQDLEERGVSFRKKIRHFLRIISAPFQLLVLSFKNCEPKQTET